MNDSTQTLALTALALVLSLSGACGEQAPPPTTAAEAPSPGAAEDSPPAETSEAADASVPPEPAQPDPEPPAQPAPPPLDLPPDLDETAVYVVLPRFAQIRRTLNPLEGSIIATRAPPGWLTVERERPVSVSHNGVLARVLAESEGVIEVQTLPRAIKGVPCRPNPHHGPYSLRGFVDASDPLSVIKSDLEIAFDDGTSIELAAGVVVEQHDQGFRPALEGVKVTVDLPPHEVGRWFEPGSTKFKHSSKTVKTKPNDYWTVDRHRTRVGIFRAPGRLKKQKHGGATHVFENECIKLRLSRDIDPQGPRASSLGNLGAIGHGGGGGSCSWSRGLPSWKIRRGTRVYWPDGSEAGETVLTHTYDCPSPDRAGDRLCFSAQSDQSSPAALVDGPICFEKSALVQIGGTKLGPLVVKATEPLVKGELKTKVVHRVVRQHVAEIRACGESFEKQGALLEGRLVVKIAVSPDGAVKTAAIASSTLPVGALDECVTTRVKAWRFPEADTEKFTIISQQYLFDH